MTFRFRIAALLAAFLTLGAVLWVSAAAPQQTEKSAPSDPAHPIARKLPTPGIRNFAEVTPTLYRGAQPTPDGIEALKKMGIDIVVDFRDGKRGSEEDAVTKLGMQYVGIPSQCYSPKDENFARFLAVVRENPGKKVFVHCKLGEDRTGMAIASYRISEQGWSADEAMKEMRSFGFSTMHHMTCPGLARYESQFPARLKREAAFKELKTQTPEKAK
jgi:tyrosine-protein phosphatase SIW14